MTERFSILRDVGHMTRLLLIAIAIVMIILAQKGRGYKTVVTMAVIAIFMIGVSPALVRLMTEKDSSVIVLSSSNDNLAKSGEAYLKGLKAMEEEDFDKAVIFLEQVLAEDPNYSDARAKLRLAVLERDKTILQQGKKKLESGDYTEAIKIFDSLIKGGSDLKEAEALKKQAQEAMDVLEKEEEARKIALDRQKARDTMGEWSSGSGGISMAVTGTRVSAQVMTSYGFSYDSPEGSGGSYVWLDISVANNGDSGVTVTPEDFTLSTVDGYMASRSEATYSQTYLEPIELKPGTKRHGWVIFFVPDSEVYTLRYYGPGGWVEKQIVVQ